MPYKVGMVSLGCPKNQVDAEIMLAKLKDKNFELTNDPSEADIVIINTCAFISDAKAEAIETIFEFVEFKKEGRIKKLVVTGCLAERYFEETVKEIPEIDAVVGLGCNGEIADICMDLLKGDVRHRQAPKERLPLNGERVLTTSLYWAYLKIAEGCDNRCSYCVIPQIRGSYRSRAMEDIIEEAKKLASWGVKELIVVAQDTTRYGEDIYGKLSLPELLNELCKIEGIKWIRLMYCYPDRITDELLEVMAAQPKIAHYLDLPLQHSSKSVLSRMNRKGDRESLSMLIKKIRGKIPDIVIRTTFIVGFPGESEDDFEELAEFIKEARFERLGCFAYSLEEGSPAASLDCQIDEEVKNRRREIVMEEQFQISNFFNKLNVGRELETLVEGYDSFIECYISRSYMDAPEIDGKIFFKSDIPHKEGDFVTVKITDLLEYDLLAEEVINK